MILPEGGEEGSPLQQYLSISDLGDKKAIKNIQLIQCSLTAYVLEALTYKFSDNFRNIFLK
jgi:hypothetical protein